MMIATTKILITTMMTIITTMTMMMMMMMMITTIASIENVSLLKSLGYIFPFLWFFKHVLSNLFGQWKVVAFFWPAKGNHTVELKGLIRYKLLLTRQN